MKETVSRIGPGGAAIERACDWSMAHATDEVLRIKCRNAPEFIRRNIDTQREARGLPPLWSTRADEQRRPGRRASSKARSEARLAQLKAFLTKARARHGR